MKTLLHITTKAVGAKPVESGKRATDKGYHKTNHTSLKSGIWKYCNNYTGMFFPDGTHMTWIYGKGSIFPEGVVEGDSGVVEVVGNYADNEVACTIVMFNGITHQP